jgi:hypothetical protein
MTAELAQRGLDAVAAAMMLAMELKEPSTWLFVALIVLGILGLVFLACL